MAVLYFWFPYEPEMNKKQKNYKIFLKGVLKNPGVLKLFYTFYACKSEIIRSFSL